MLSAPPEFLFCESSDGHRQFILHTTSPRFLGEIFDEDDADAVLDEVSIGLNNGQTLANIIWLDAHSKLSIELVQAKQTSADEKSFPAELICERPLGSETSLCVARVRLKQLSGAHATSRRSMCSLRNKIYSLRRVNLRARGACG